MPAFRATNPETQQVVDYEAESPDSEHLSPPWRVEEVSPSQPGTEPPPPSPPDRPEDWYIGVGPFWDRFGQYKIAILASSDPVVQAIIKDSSVRKYLDLKGRRADIAGALDALIAKGFPLAKDSILDTRPGPLEVHRGE